VSAAAFFARVLCDALTWRPAASASSRQRCKSFSYTSASASSFLRGWRLNPGTTAAAIHVVIVLIWSSERDAGEPL
jgi:hypothetical protein